MSRRRAAKKRVVNPDAKFGNVELAKFMNCLMISGKKSVAEGIVYKALETMSERLSIDPIEAFEGVINNVKPLIEVRSRRVGGATYQVPVEVRSSRSKALAMRWLINAARARKSEKDMSMRLAMEMIDAYNSKGAAIKKRDDTHKMAEANRAFAHYRW
jgi:small subunit ribosomal protein S7